MTNPIDVLTEDQRDAFNDARSRYTDDVFAAIETYAALQESAYRALVKSLAKIGLSPADVANEMPTPPPSLVATLPVPRDLIPHEPLGECQIYPPLWERKAVPDDAPPPY